MGCCVLGWPDLSAGGWWVLFLLGLCVVVALCFINDTRERGGVTTFKTGLLLGLVGCSTHQPRAFFFYRIGFVVYVVNTVSIRVGDIGDEVRGPITTGVTKISFIYNRVGNYAIYTTRYNPNGVGTTLYTRVVTSHFSTSRVVGVNINYSLSPSITVGGVIITDSIYRCSVSVATLNRPEKCVGNLGAVGVPAGRTVSRGLSRVTVTSNREVRHNAITDKSAFVTSPRLGTRVTSDFNTVYNRVRNNTVNRITTTGGVPFTILHSIDSKNSTSTTVSCPAFGRVTTRGSATVVLGCVRSGGVRLRLSYW